MRLDIRGFTYFTAMAGEFSIRGSVFVTQRFHADSVQSRRAAESEIRCRTALAKSKRTLGLLPIFSRALRVTGPAGEGEIANSHRSPTFPASLRCTSRGHPSLTSHLSPLTLLHRPTVRPCHPSTLKSTFQLKLLRIVDILNRLLLSPDRQQGIDQRTYCNHPRKSLGSTRWREGTGEGSAIDRRRLEKVLRRERDDVSGMGYRRSRYLLLLLSPYYLDRLDQSGRTRYKRWNCMSAGHGDLFDYCWPSTCFRVEIVI